MIHTNKKKKNCILNLLTGLVAKKGHTNLAKNLIINFSKTLCKRQTNIGFYNLFENLIKNALFPLKIIKKRKKYKYTHRPNTESISNFINSIITKLKNNKKRISFNFYFKNEIYKLLNNFETIDSSKQDIIDILLNNKNSSSKLITKKFNENKAKKNITLKKHKININYKILLMYHNITKPFIYLGTNKHTFSLLRPRNIIKNKIKNLNYI